MVCDVCLWSMAVVGVDVVEGGYVMNRSVNLLRTRLRRLRWFSNSS